MLRKLKSISIYFDKMPNPRTRLLCLPAGVFRSLPFLSFLIPHLLVPQESHFPDFAQTFSDDGHLDSDHIRAGRAPRGTRTPTCCACLSSEANLTTLRNQWCKLPTPGPVQGAIGGADCWGRQAIHLSFIADYPLGKCRTVFQVCFS
jgi:hypothetical protein